MITYCLYQDFPFRVYFRGLGFQRPRKDEKRLVRSYNSEGLAKIGLKLIVHSHKLNIEDDPILITKRENLINRMKYDWE